MSVQHIFLRPFKQANDRATNALRELGAFIAEHGDGFDVPHICILESPARIGSPEGWREIVAAVASSGMDGAREAAAYLSANPPEKTIDGCVASVLLTRTVAGRNAVAVMACTPEELAVLPPPIALAYLLHEFHHCCRFGVEKIPSHRQEGKADTFALLSLAGRVAIAELDTYVDTVGFRTSPLTGRMADNSNDLREPKVYPIAYAWPLLRPLAEAIAQSGSPLAIVEAMRLTDAFWDHAFIPSGADAAAYDAAKQLCLAHVGYEFGASGIATALADDRLHPVMRAVLTAYATGAADLAAGADDTPERLLTLDAHEARAWDKAAAWASELSDALSQRNASPGLK